MTLVTRSSCDLVTNTCAKVLEYLDVFWRDEKYNYPWEGCLFPADLTGRNWLWDSTNLNSIKLNLHFSFSGTLIGLFSQVRTGGDIVRDRALKFLHLKLKTEGNELISSKDTESILLQEIKLSIEECTADEFVMFMAMLGATSLPKTMRYFLI